MNSRYDAIRCYATTRRWEEKTIWRIWIPHKVSSRLQRSPYCQYKSISAIAISFHIKSNLNANSSLNLFDFLMFHSLGSNEYRPVIPFSERRKKLYVTKGSLQDGSGCPINYDCLLKYFHPSVEKANNFVSYSC